MVELVECDTGAIVPIGPLMEVRRRTDIFGPALKAYEMINPGGFVAMCVEHGPLIEKYAIERYNELVHGTEPQYNIVEEILILFLADELYREMNLALPIGFWFGSSDDDETVVGIWKRDEL